MRENDKDLSNAREKERDRVTADSSWLKFWVQFRKREISDFAVDGYITVFWCADYEYDNENHRQGHFQGQNLKKLLEK